MREDFEDLLYQRNKVWRMHCGSWVSSTQVNFHHSPTKVVSQRPLPLNLPAIAASLEVSQRRPA